MKMPKYCSLWSRGGGDNTDWGQGLIQCIHRVETGRQEDRYRYSVGLCHSLLCLFKLNCSCRWYTQTVTIYFTWRSLWNGKSVEVCGEEQRHCHTGMGVKTIECKHVCLLAMEDTLLMANMGWWYYTLIGHVINLWETWTPWSIMMSIGRLFVMNELRDNWKV